MPQLSSHSIHYSKQAPSADEHILEVFFWDILNDKVALPQNGKDISDLHAQIDDPQEKKYVASYHQHRLNLTRKSELEEEVENLGNISFKELLYLNRSSIADLLAYLTPSELHKRYGEIGLFWVWFESSTLSWEYHTNNDPQKIAQEIYRDYLIHHTKLIGSHKRYELLSKAKKTQKQKSEGKLPIDTLRQFYAFAGLEDFIKKQDLADYLANASDFSLEDIYAREDFPRWSVKGWEWKDLDHAGRDMIDKTKLIDRTNKYDEIKTIGNNADWSGRVYKIFLDSPVWIMLKHQDLPVAIVGFSIRDEHTLFINQFEQIAHIKANQHGVMIGKFVDEIIKVTDWQGLLYDLLCRYTKELWLTHMVIQEGEQNEWCTIAERRIDVVNGRSDSVKWDTMHLSRKVAHKVYDVFAEKHGFTKDASVWGNWIKEID